MVAGRQLRHLAKHGTKMLQTLKIVAQPSKAGCRTGVSFAVSFSIAQPDAARLGKIRRQHDVQQTSLPVCPHFRYASQRIGKSPPRLPVAQLSPFRVMSIPRLSGKKPATTGDRVGFAAPQRSPAQDWRSPMKRKERMKLSREVFDAYRLLQGSALKRSQHRKRSGLFYKTLSGAVR